MTDGHSPEQAPAQTTPQGSQKEGVEHGHEGTDVDLRSVIQWFSLVALTMAASIAVMWWVFHAWSAYEETTERLPSPLFGQQQVPPLPQVLPNLADTRAHQERMRGPSELLRDYRQQEDQALIRAGLEAPDGRPQLPPAAMAALPRQPTTSTLFSGLTRPMPSSSSGGTALENDLAGE